MQHGVSPKLVSVLVLALGLVFGACSQSPTDKDIEKIGISGVRDMQSQAERDPAAMLLIDARSSKAYAAEHVPKAVNIQLYEVDKERGARAGLKRYHDLVVYGDDAGSAPAIGLTKRLMETGYKSVLLFAGGLKEWKATGLPTEKGGGEGTSVAPPSP